MLIREGLKTDAPKVLELIRELAEYENAPEEVELTVGQLEKDGFGESPIFGLLVAENSDNSVVGISLFYFRYSTWKGKTLYLEDLVVTPSERGKGFGKALFEATISRAKAESCSRMSWQVLDWNEPAIKFYEKYGATFEKQWVNCELYKTQLDVLESKRA